MNDWVPVLVIALVVCVTAYLLLDPQLRPREKAARTCSPQEPRVGATCFPVGAHECVLPPKSS
jgi:hypothetical protein